MPPTRVSGATVEVTILIFTNFSKNKKQKPSDAQNTHLSSVKPKSILKVIKQQPQLDPMSPIYMDSPLGRAHNDFCLYFIQLLPMEKKIPRYQKTPRKKPKLGTRRTMHRDNRKPP